MKRYTYTIYHILGVKIGCTVDFEKRMKDQSFTNWEILWQEEGDYEFGWIAGEKEQELQKQYGYKVDDVNYQQSRENRFKNYNLGSNRRDSGHDAHTIILNKDQVHQSNAGRNGGKKTQSIEYTCCHCNKAFKGTNYFRWHGDKCKHKKS